MLCYAMLCHAMLCSAMQWNAMLCYAMLCYAVVCYAMLCYARRAGGRYVPVRAGTYVPVRTGTYRHVPARTFTPTYTQILGAIDRELVCSATPRPNLVRGRGVASITLSWPDARSPDAGMARLRRRAFSLNQVPVACMPNESRGYRSMHGFRWRPFREGEAAPVPKSSDSSPEGSPSNFER